MIGRTNVQCRGFQSGTRNGKFFSSSMLGWIMFLQKESYSPFQLSNQGCRYEEDKLGATFITGPSGQIGQKLWLNFYLVNSPS